jgi:hypothetical protein
MWTPQSTASATHWIQACEIITFIHGHNSPGSICPEERSYNRRVHLNRANEQTMTRDILLKFPAIYY